MELLAGAIDGAATRHHNHSNLWRFRLPPLRSDLFQQIVFVAQSLGLCHTLPVTTASANSKALSVLFGGAAQHHVPVCDPHKRLTPFGGARAAPLSITKVSARPFYGFQLAVPSCQPARFLMSDFTVTHNCKLLLHRSLLLAVPPCMRLCFCL
jgi:hypothetical protein